MERFKIFSLWGLFGLVLLFACRENKPRGDEMSWSPTGDRLAFVNFESNELLVAEFENEKLVHIIVADSGLSNKEKFAAPDWSRDGKYLLFTQTDSSETKIWLYDWNQRNKKLLRSFPNKKNKKQLLSTPKWSPTSNRIMWGELADRNKIQLWVSQKPTFQFSQIPLEGNFFQAEWEKGGNGIFYLSCGSKKEQENGIWKINLSDFSQQQFYRSNNLKGFSVSNLGSQIAVIEKMAIKKTHHFQLALVDTQGNLKERIQELPLEIKNICWAPDGKQLAWQTGSDTTSNIWLWDFDYRRPVRLTFDDAKKLVGWSSTMSLFYTTKCPDFLLKINPAFTEYQEFINAIQGQNFESQLFEIKNSKRQIREKNVAVYSPFNANGQAGFYRIVEPRILHPEVYCPVVTFKNRKPIFLARTPVEHSIAASEFYRIGAYEAALQHLAFNSPDFTEVDSSSLPTLFKQLESGDLTLKILTLRKLNQIDKANLLFNQFIELNFKWLDDSENLDNFFWSNVGIYSQLREIEAGIKDLEALLRNEKSDSLLKSHALFAQAILASESKNWATSIDKLTQAIRLFPASFNEWNDIQSLLSLQVSLDKNLKKEQFETAMELLLKRLTDPEKKDELWELAGNYYNERGNSQQALTNYQKAVTHQFDKNEIWQKIFEIQSN